jgi:hypothetical protein
MRTTVTIDPDVQALLEKAVRERGQSFDQALNDAVRAGLQMHTPTASAPDEFDFPVFSLGAPLLDLSKAHALAAQLEDHAMIERMLR